MKAVMLVLLQLVIMIVVMKLVMVVMLQNDNINKGSNIGSGHDG